MLYTSVYTCNARGGENIMNNKIKQMVYAGLLTALAIVIPIQFGFLRIVIPPYFTATLAAHVPMMLSMLISPFVAAVVGIGSTIGFFNSWNTSASSSKGSNSYSCRICWSNDNYEK